MRRLAALLPAAACVAFGAALTTQGGCWPSFGDGGGVVEPPPTIALATRYVLVTVGGQQPPRVIRQEADGTVIRLIADTLTFTPGGTAASGTVDEVAVLGTIRPGQAEVVGRVTRTGVAYTRQQYNGLVFAESAALARPQVQASVSGPSAAAADSELFVFGEFGALGFAAR